MDAITAREVLYLGLAACCGVGLVCFLAMAMVIAMAPRWEAPNGHVELKGKDLREE